MGIRTMFSPFAARTSSHREYATPSKEKGRMLAACSGACSEALKDLSLSGEAYQLKAKILETHPIKSLRFSLSHMRHLAIPPVQVPKTLRGANVFAAMVGGKKVPFSRDMWCNRKRRANRRRLDVIHESLVFS
ncbi:hypothetical protein PINS_up000629 [Pythium insidiosum]|nr:hypothetical protein PINS_up000629 [Pythium insidiosum]